MTIFNYSSTYKFVCFDGEEENVENTSTNNTNNTKTTFTQEEVNAIMAKENRRTKEAQKALLSQLEEVKKTAKMGSDERAELEKKIEELSRQTMTAEERARQKETKLQKQYEEERLSIEKEKEDWKKRHTELLVSNQLLKSAVSNKAIEPNQLLKMLRNDIRVVQKVDEDGKPTDGFEVRMNLMDTDKNNKPIELDLTVEEGIKRMTELPQYGNLFEGGKSGGIGGDNAANRRNGKIDVAKLAKTDPAAYRELRKKNPELIFGSKK
jgi:hypothetical protein